MESIQEQERDTEPCLPYDVFAKTCPSRGTLEHVTWRWGGLTLSALYDGSLAKPAAIPNLPAKEPA